MKVLVYLYAGSNKNEDIEQFVLNDYIPGIRQVYPVFHLERCNFLSGGGILTVGHMDDAPPPPAYCATIEGQVRDADLPIFLQQLEDPTRESEARALSADRLDHDRTLRVAVEERSSSAEEQEQNSVASGESDMVKQIVNLRRKSDISHNEFIKYYEDVHAPLTVETLPMFVKYTRNYAIDDDRLQRALNPRTQSGCDFDVATHLWFKSEAMRRQFSSAFNEPEIGQMFAEDSAKLFEPGSMQMFLVDESVLEEARAE